MRSLRLVGVRLLPWYLQTVSSSLPWPMLSPKRMRHSAKPWYMVSQ